MDEADELMKRLNGVRLEIVVLRAAFRTADVFARLLAAMSVVDGAGRCGSRRRTQRTPNYVEHVGNPIEAPWRSVPVGPVFELLSGEQRRIEI